MRKCYHLECHGFLEGWGEGSVSKCDSNVFGTKYVDASASICCFDSDSYFLHMLAGSEAVGEEMSVCQHAA